MMKNKSLSTRWIGLLLALLLPVAAFADSYTYDATGRLTSATYTDGSSVTYTYDANGNILNKTIAAAGSGKGSIQERGSRLAIMHFLKRRGVTHYEPPCQVRIDFDLPLAGIYHAIAV